MVRRSRPLSLNDNDILTQGYKFSGLDFRTTSFMKIVGDPDGWSVMIHIWPDRNYHKYTVTETLWPNNGKVIDRGVLKHEQDLRALNELAEERIDIPF